MHSIMCFHFVRSACWQSPQCNQCLCVLRPYQKPQFKVCSTCRPSPSCAFSFCTSEQESLCIPPISIHQPSPSQSVLVRSSLCIPPTGNPPLQSVRVCPTSASATTVHCVFHLPQSELVLSISTPVNENHFCSPYNREPDRNQCLWIPWCAFHYVLPFCSFCLLATTPMQSVPVCPMPVSETTIQSVLHPLPITGLCFLFLHQ